MALDREAGLLPERGGGVGRADRHSETRAKPRGARGHRGGAPGRTDVEALAAAGRGRPRDGGPRRRPADEARRAARPVSARGGPFAKEAADDAGAGGRGARAARAAGGATSAIAEAALVDLDKRLRELLRQARLTHIDAVIGKKKKLEIEIANLREGRYPAEHVRELQLEGLMGDDEEYWPFEGEYWSDEYENYK